MRAEILERLNTIIEADVQSGNQPIFTTFDQEYPSSLDDSKLSACLWYPRLDTNYEQRGGTIYDTEMTYHGYFFLQKYGMGLSTIANLRALVIPDMVIDSLLSRPNLEYDDNGLGGSFGSVYRPISVRVISDLSRPLRYPIGGASEGTYYWGFIMNVVIPFQRTVSLAT